ncbi:MAG: hypothetical protein ACFFDT_36315 [Candidatus Hodarchaeota archaeon]
MLKEIEAHAESLVTELLNDKAITGVVISDNEGNAIYSSFTPEEDSEMLYDSEKLAPVAATVISVSTGSMRKLFNQSLESVVCVVEDDVFFLVPGPKANVLACIDQEVVSLRGAEYYQDKLFAVVREISALMETVGLEETLVIKVKRIIPEALAVGIVTREGLPLAFQTIIDDAALAAAANGIYVLASAMSGRPGVDYIAAQADQASLILHRMEEEKTLVVVVPKEQKLGEYIVKIKQVLQN